MQNVYIVKANRTPFGKIGGSLASVRTDDLLALSLKHLISDVNFDLALIDDIHAGCANQAGEDNRNVARMSAILAGIPLSVPANTINRLCGSSLDSVASAYARISSGMSDCVIACGVESMSRGPYVLSKGESAYDRSQKMYDTSFGWRFPNPKMKEMFELLGMGQTAENLVERYNITRLEQDQFALNSHIKAAIAKNNGNLAKQIVPITIQKRKSTEIVEHDECIRETSTLETLAKLRPVFKENGSVTAANSSPMNDGASSILIVSEKFLKEHNLRPMVKINGAAVRGVHPSTMGIGPVESTKTLMAKYKTNIGHYDIIELNEAFAAQALSCIKELEINPDVVNPCGGAIAIGHPLGASGTRIMTSLAYQMNENKNLKNGLATMCIGVGQGISISVENCK
jgi:acetyl-CoA acyltransferase